MIRRPQQQLNVDTSLKLPADDSDEVKQPNSPLNLNLPSSPNPLSPTISPRNGANKFVIVSSSTLSDTEIAKLKNMGKVVVYDDKYAHISIDLIDFDYLVIKLTEDSEHWILDNVLNNTDKYHIIAICKESEQWIDDIHAENTLKKLPDSLAACEKDKYDNRLLVKGKLTLPDKSLATKFKKMFSQCLPVANIVASAVSKKL